MNLTKEQNISNELKSLRLALSPVISEHYKEVLKEAERLLNGEVSIVPLNHTKRKAVKEKRPTKQELYNRFFYK